MKRLLTIAALVLIARPAVRGIHAQTIARRFVHVTDARLQKPTNSNWLIMQERTDAGPARMRRRHPNLERPFLSFLWSASYAYGQQTVFIRRISIEPPSRQDRRIVPRLHR
jgi:hypothetical protein